MIDANELRIGNWVYVGDLIGQINQCSFYDTYDFDPIPITEEWLLKFGFTQYLKTNIYQRYDSMIEIIGNNDSGFGFNFNSKLLRRVNYIHELQNIYFALRGQELTLCK